MNPRVRAIIIDSGKIALIKRVRNGELYYVIPGGGIEAGENYHEALVREIKEELGIEIAIGDLFEKLSLHYDESDSEKTHYFYLCKETGGTFGSGTGPEYTPENPQFHDGTYEPVKIPLSELKDIPLYPEEIKQAIIKKLVK
ncbi:MAG: NUDIX domain-containing protein [Candidatus Pacebacteria bacterium]|nr:NUDIX domain-containing protein [Candidatus Paceibacterota bacterium]